MPSVYNLTNKIHVTDYREGVPNLNMPFHNGEFRLHRGVMNVIEFQVKNRDRKPVDVTGSTIIIAIRDTSNNQMLLWKATTLVDGPKGKVRLTVLPTETVDWQMGSYHYSILFWDGVSDWETLLYMNESFAGMGVVHLSDSALPSPITSHEITTFTPVGRLYGQEPFFVSSALPGSSMTDYLNTVHTLAVYCTDFSGSFWMEGSIEENIPGEEGWFVIDLMDTPDWKPERYTGVMPFSVDACLMWVRFVYLPHATNRGTVDKILYRN